MDGAEPAVIEMPEPLGIFAGSLFSRGTEYLSAFEHLTREGALPYAYAGSFLFSHSLELLLKSYLVARGMSKQETRRIGHNLPVLLSRCETAALPEVRNLRAFVNHYHEMNKDFDFRYPSGYKLSIPRPADSLRIGSDLRDAIARFVEAERISAELKFASSTRHLRGSRIRWSD